MEFEFRPELHAMERIGCSCYPPGFIQPIQKSLKPWKGSSLHKAVSCGVCRMKDKVVQPPWKNFGQLKIGCEQCGIRFNPGAAVPKRQCAMGIGCGQNRLNGKQKRNPHMRLFNLASLFTSIS